MIARVARIVCCIAALLCAQCGYVGFDLLPLESDGGTDDASVADAGAADADIDDARSHEAGVAADAEALDATLIDDARAMDTMEAAVEDATVTIERAPDADVEDATVDAQIVDAHSQDAQSTDASSTHDAAPVPCDLSGDWVAKIDIVTSWPAGAAVAGSGTTSLWLRYQASASGGLVGNSLVDCGLALPAYTSLPALGGETYQPSLPSALFDATPGRVLASNVNVSISGSGLLGDTVNIAQTAFVLGTTLSDPVNASWPANSALVDDDQDMDGQLGVTLLFSSTDPRIDESARADQGYVAGRVAWGGSVKITSCGELDGPITVTHLDTHFVGCRVSGGTACTSAQRDLLDGARPLYSAGSASMRALKVPAATCALARSMLP